MSFSRDDFMQLLVAEASNHPLVAQYFQAGDPRILANLGAMASMMALLSQQIDVESMEPFNKVRDTTVLADAAMKGILPFARPPRMSVSILNESTGPLQIDIGRRFIDQQGHIYVAETTVTIAAGQTGTVNIKQVTTRTFTHLVANSTPFYGVTVPTSSDSDLFISGVIVKVAGVLYPYVQEFANMAAGQVGFTLETDEYRRLIAKFGWQSTFGVQPANGTAIEFTIEETYGQTTLPVNAAFTFETIAQPQDQFAKITLASVLYPGTDPLNIDTLREYAKYPSIYDSSAVYLGNFDFLVRRNLFPLRFLSIWNEQIEEAVRGPSVNNINRLFVSALMDGVDATWMQNEIRRIIKAADDSYWIKFVTPVEVAVPLTVNAQVSVVHDVGDVQAKIRAEVYALYGRDSEAAKKGMLTLNNKLISDTLRKKVAALQDAGSDFQVTIPAQTSMLPEQFRYVSAASLTVNVTQSTYNDGMWSY